MIKDYKELIKKLEEARELMIKNNSFDGLYEVSYVIGVLMAWDNFQNEEIKEMAEATNGAV